MPSESVHIYPTVPIHLNRLSGLIHLIHIEFYPENLIFLLMQTAHGSQRCYRHRTAAIHRTVHKPGLIIARTTISFSMALAWFKIFQCSIRLSGHAAGTKNS